MTTKNVVVERRIEATPGPVWETLTDLKGLERVLGGVDRVEVLTEGGFGVGTRWRETRRMLGREATEEMRVTVSEPPDRYVVEADSHGMHYVTEFTLRPAGPGATMVRMTFSATPAGGAASGLLARLLGDLGSRAVRRAVARDLADVAVAVQRHG
ncbi:SRPBCC family protein [Streptomyces sp. NBC_01216]|uniref:SRPBCC family protein n=1 Tax=unclassified Streptomyces TaxID=2593676 RepID=UPI002E10C9A4|nr:SRPBCC family protein [Streptomyces sp. NBC_01216]